MPLDAGMEDLQDWVRFGAYVSHRRRELGLSQRDIEKLDVGISEATLYKIENAKQSSYAPRTLRMLCKTLEWTPSSASDVLHGGEPTQSKWRDYVEAPKALSGKLDQLTDLQRAKIEALVDEMLPDE